MTVVEAVSAESFICSGVGLYIPSGPTGDHLFVVITDVRIIDGKAKVLLASIESRHEKSDTACCLDVGDHEFIRHPSFVGYKHCRIEDVKDLEAYLASGYYRQAEAFSEPTIERIREGYRVTSRVPRHIKRDWGSL